MTRALLISVALLVLAGSASAAPLPGCTDPRAECCNAADPACARTRTPGEIRTAHWDEMTTTNVIVYDPYAADLPPVFYRDPHRFCDTLLAVNYATDLGDHPIILKTHAGTLTCKPDGDVVITAGVPKP